MFANQIVSAAVGLDATSGIDENVVNKQTIFDALEQIESGFDSPSDSDDELDDAQDLINLPDLSNILKSETKVYQRHLPIQNGIYEGCVNEKIIREGLGVFSVNNGEDYYLGIWQDDKLNGEGYQSKHYGSIRHYGRFDNDVLISGYGNSILKNGYIYEGRYEKDKFHGLGCLSIRIEGLSNEFNGVLKLIAEWDQDKVSITYKNQIKDCYEEHYKKFNKCLESCAKVNNLNIQKTYFQVLIQFLEENMQEKNLLKAITGDPVLPQDLKFAADILYRLDYAFEILNSYMRKADTLKSYTECVTDACKNGLISYANRLKWFGQHKSEELNSITLETIFDTTLTQFTINASNKKCKWSDFKEIFKLNPSVIELIKKMAGYANEKIGSIPFEYQAAFIHVHTKRLKSIWLDYLECLNDESKMNKFDNDNEFETAVEFYRNAYLSLLNNCTVIENYLEIKLNVNSDKHNLSINLNNKNFKFADSNAINLIVFKSKKEMHSIYKQYDSETFLKEFDELLNSLNENDLLIISLSNKHGAVLNESTTSLLVSHGFDCIANLASYNCLLILFDKKRGKIEERFSVDESSVQVEHEFCTEFITDDFKNNIQEILDLREEADFITYNSMDFILKNLKPWRTIKIDIVNNYLTQSYSSLTIKEIGDKMLVKILNDAKLLIENYLNKDGKVHLVNFNHEFEVFVNNYDIDLTNEDTSLSYEFKVKEINEILNYFLSIVSIGESDYFILDLIKKQLANITNFHSKEKITKLIKSFIEFNEEFTCLFRIFEENFSSVRDKCELKCKGIIEACKQLFGMLLEVSDDTNNESLKSEYLEMRFKALRMLKNFINALTTLDYTFYVGKDRIKEEIGDDIEPFVDKTGPLMKVLNIGIVIDRLDGPVSHVLLDILYDYVRLFIVEDLLCENSSKVKNLEARIELIGSVNKIIKYLNDQSRYSSLDEFDKDFIDHYNHLVYSKFSFEEFIIELGVVENFMVYGRKLNEKTIENALEFLAEKNKSSSRDSLEWIRSSYMRYEDAFQKYIDFLLTNQITIEGLIEEARSKAKLLKEMENWNEATHELLAITSVILSLGASNCIINTGEDTYSLKENINDKCILKPNCVQILAILRIFATGGQNGIDNQLLEILPGEGKSWIFALLASIFGLLDYKVTISSHSDYVLKMHEKDFFRYMKPLHVNHQVRYTTFADMCIEMLIFENANYSLQDLVSNIFYGKELKPQSDFIENECEKSILFIDEIDVFLSNYVGEMYYAFERIYSDSLRIIQKLIMENAVQLNEDKNKFEQMCLSKLERLRDNDAVIDNLFKANILEDYLKEMLSCARSVYNSPNDYVNLYEVVDNNIFTKTPHKSLNNFLNSSFHSQFYYLKFVHEQVKFLDSANLNEKCYGYLSIKYAALDYLKLLESHDIIVGISANLTRLSSIENSILNRNRIKNIHFIPSFFPAQNVLTSFKISRNEQQWYEYMVDSCKNIIKSRRAVLIFFENEKYLNGFCKYIGDIGVKPVWLTTTKLYNGVKVLSYSHEEARKLVGNDYTGVHGSMTLSTREFSRGTDFQIDAKVAKEKGIHVMQTFCSLDVKEELQIKKRPVCKYSSRIRKSTFSVSVANDR